MGGKSQRPNNTKEKHIFIYKCTVFIIKLIILNNRTNKGKTN